MGGVFWAIEIRCILEQNINGTEGLSEWLMPLKKASAKRLNSLIYEILSDRCDDTFLFLHSIQNVKIHFLGLKV